MPVCKYYQGIDFGTPGCEDMQQQPRSLCPQCPEPGLAEAREKLKSLNTEHTEDTGGGMKEKQNKVKKSKKTEHKVKTPLGDITLTPDTLTPDTRVVKETTIILDKKLLKLAAGNTKTLAGIVRVLRDHIEDQALRIAELERRVEDLENERDAIGRMAQRLSSR